MIFNFTFNDHDAQIMMDALSKLPYFQVADMIQAIRTQAEQQVQAQNIQPEMPKE